MVFIVFWKETALLLLLFLIIIIIIIIIIHFMQRHYLIPERYRFNISLNSILRAALASCSQSQSERIHITNALRVEWNVGKLALQPPVREVDISTSNQEHYATTTRLHPIMTLRRSLQTSHPGISLAASRHAILVCRLSSAMLTKIYVKLSL